MLNPIDKNDLIPDSFDDSSNTLLELDDYDWMSYRLSTIFYTKNDGKLEVLFEYYGCTESSMTVTQITDGNPKITKEYQYKFSSKLFEKHIILFLQAHIASWQSEKAFNGENNVIQFYNEVLNQGTLEY